MACARPKRFLGDTLGEDVADASEVNEQERSEPKLMPHGDVQIRNLG